MDIHNTANVTLDIDVSAAFSSDFTSKSVRNTAFSQVSRKKTEVPLCLSHGTYNPTLSHSNSIISPFPHYLNYTSDGGKEVSTVYKESRVFFGVMHLDHTKYNII